jgi:hypothetical protein
VFSAASSLGRQQNTTLQLEKSSERPCATGAAILNWLLGLAWGPRSQAVSLKPDSSNVRAALRISPSASLKSTYCAVSRTEPNVYARYWQHGRYRVRKERYGAQPVAVGCRILQTLSVYWKLHVFPRGFTSSVMGNDKRSGNLQDSFNQTSGGDSRLVFFKDWLVYAYMAGTRSPGDPSCASDVGASLSYRSNWLGAIVEMAKDRCKLQPGLPKLVVQCSVKPGWRPAPQWEQVIGGWTEFLVVGNFPDRH